MASEGYMEFLARVHYTDEAEVRKNHHVTGWR